jgi:hypothetical protein
MKQKVLYCIIILVLLLLMANCNADVVSRVSKDEGKGYVDFLWSKNLDIMDMYFSFKDEELMIYLMDDETIEYLPRDDTTEKNGLTFKVKLISKAKNPDSLRVSVSLYKNSWGNAVRKHTWNVSLKGKVETQKVEFLGNTYDIISRFYFEGEETATSFNDGGILVREVNFVVTKKDDNLNLFHISDKKITE